MTLSEYRRDNLRALVKANGGVTAVASRLGYRNASFLSQQVGPNPSREVTEKTARALEAEFGLEPGALDQPPTGQNAPQPAIPTALIADVIRLVGGVLEAEGVQAGPGKFSELVALAVVDTLEHDGKPREAHIRTIAKLLK